MTVYQHSMWPKLRMRLPEPDPNEVFDWWCQDCGEHKHGWPATPNCEAHAVPMRKIVRAGDLSQHFYACVCCGDRPDYPYPKPAPHCTDCRLPMEVVRPPMIPGPPTVTPEAGR